MKKVIILTAIIAVTGTAVFVSCNEQATAKETTFNTTDFTPEQIKHGEYLVTAMGCDDCHSPKVMGAHGPEVDFSRRFAGHPSDVPVPAGDSNILKNWVLMAPDLTVCIGPWGTTFAANLTSDSTGIGMWKFEQFKTAIREGKFMGLEGTRPIMPPMPWTQYKNLSDEDLRDMFAFLKSTKPVHNVVPDFIPATAMK